MPQAEAVSVPVEHLDHVASAIAKHKKVSGERVHLQLVGHHDGKAIDLLSHVRAASRQVYPGMGG